MKRSIHGAATVIAIALLAGCATEGPVDPGLLSIDESKLPAADIHVNIPGLGPCTDNPDRTLHLNSHQPVTMLVHGCFGSSGSFRGLAQVLAFHGQQTACFTYNDRDSLMLSSAQLASAFDQLAQKMNNKHVTLIGHSQGALITRKSMIVNRLDAIHDNNEKIRLVTISGPFSGIAAANHCGALYMRVLTLGLVMPICKLITGDKWSEITYNSAFIREPGALDKQVQSHLKVVTDERGTCRQSAQGGCTESDEVFSLDEQYNAVVDHDAVTTVMEINAGHIEIVGDKRVAPVKLIALLQQQGIINATEPQRRADLRLLLAKVYGVRKGSE